MNPRLKNLVEGLVSAPIDFVQLLAFYHENPWKIPIRKCNSWNNPPTFWDADARNKYQSPTFGARSSSKSGLCVTRSGEGVLAKKLHGNSWINGDLEKACESCTPWMFNIDPENRPKFPKRSRIVFLCHHFSGAKMLNFGGVSRKRTTKHSWKFLDGPPELWGLKTKEMMPEGKLPYIGGWNPTQLY